jgi:hypothetical protein
MNQALGHCIFNPPSLLRTSIFWLIHIEHSKQSEQGHPKHQDGLEEEGSQNAQDSEGSQNAQDSACIQVS